MTAELLAGREGRVLTLTLDRPQARNALTASLLGELESALGEAAGARDGPGCVVLRGSGGQFSVGMDLTVMAGLTPPENQELIGEGGPLRRAIAAIESFPYPVIACVRGYALGAACELAVSCDLRVGTPTTLMGMPPAKLGIVYPPEGLERFSRLLGPAVAKRLFFTASRFTAEELVHMGMLDFVAGEEELDSFVSVLSGEVAGLAPLSMAGHKKALQSIAAGTPAKEMTVELVEQAMKSEDAREGILSFLEKRPPVFKGE